MEKRKIKKAIAIMLIMLMVLGAFAIITAGNMSAGKRGKHGQAGNSNVGHLYLYEKDPDTWEIIEGGAWGKMKYNLAGPEFCFVFNGHNLVSGTEYVLVFYKDPWPGTPLICLGHGTANDEGDVHIMGSVDIGDISSTKTWLVPSSFVDYGTPKMKGFDATQFLLEYEPISYDDTDVP